MSRLRLIAVMVFCVALVPALASAGNGAPTGSCYWDGGPDSPVSIPSSAEGFPQAQCVDGFTEEECANLIKGGFSWQEGVPCTERNQGFAWDGSCFVPDVDMFGDVYVLVWIDAGQDITSQHLRVGQVTDPTGGNGNTWYTGLACGGVPVPTAPPRALALMMLILLAGSLGILAFRNSSAYNKSCPHRGFETPKRPASAPAVFLLLGVQRYRER